MGFSSASLFPERKREAVTQGGTRGIDHPTRRKTQGAGIYKGWEGKIDRGTFQIHSRKPKITRARTPFVRVNMIKGEIINVD